MHINKNITETLFNTLLNMPEKTKDGPKARHNLKFLNIKKDMWYPDSEGDDDDDEKTKEGTQGHRIRSKKNEVMLRTACFTLSEEELHQLFMCLLGVKFPHGYAGKIRRY